MCTQVKSSDRSSNDYLLMKGASEYIIRSCSHIHVWETGKIEPVTEELRKKMFGIVKELNTKRLRTLGLCYKNLTQSMVENMDKNEDAQGVYNIEKDNFTMICIVGIRDVLRENVKESVAKCINAGIKVRMVTGDNKMTAEAIAIECGIVNNQAPGYTSEEHVYVGEDFWNKIEGLEEIAVKDDDNKPVIDKFNNPVVTKRIKNQKAFDEIYKSIDVIARCRPEDKFAMVLGLIHNGHVVAVTGDGTNDAPALKKADVGFAMGLAGT